MHLHIYFVVYLKSTKVERIKILTIRAQIPVKKALWLVWVGFGCVFQFVVFQTNGLTNECVPYLQCNRS